MKKDNAPKLGTIERTLESLSTRKRTSKVYFFILMILYISTTLLISHIARSQDMIQFAGLMIPVSAFTGVLSSLGNICIILIVVLFDKVGFITALTIILGYMPVLLYNLLVSHTVASLPGIFSNIFTVIALVLLYTNNVMISRYQKKLRDQAITDMLTGLPNRFACSELIDDLIKHGNLFVLVAINLNNFKSINDTLGLEAGNEVLKIIAARFKEAADSGATGTLDFITRQSGDEFSLIIRGSYSDNEIRKTIEYYQAEMEKKITVDNCDFFITASFGYAGYPADSDNLNGLFACAEAALEEVKRSNSSEHILRYTADMLKTGRSLEIERMIRNAIENNTIFFNLQPQFDMSHKLRGFETLARMKDEDGNIVSPGEFIPVAEKAGLIDKVDSIVFRKSAMFIGDLIKKTGSDITLSVNVSVRHLMKNDFINELMNIVSTCGIPAEQIEIEITESVMIESVDKALQRINTIKELGLQIAIDDFGTGYSSLSYLNRFPATLLKIDKSFIDKMNSGESSKQYVAAIISIGHIMNFDVISEGVEQPEQLETLREIGCDYIQGFIWGRPLAPEAAEELVMNASQS